MRVKISLPDREPHFVSHRTISVGDLNYGNHMGNDKFLLFAHEARIQFFKSQGQEELNFYGKGLIMADAMIQYKDQGFWGDQVQQNLWLISEGRSNFDIYYQFLKTTKKDKNPQTMAIIKTAMVFYDYDKEGVSRPPEIFLNKWVTNTSNN